jgi:hypothetical protein
MAVNNDSARSVGMVTLFRRVIGAVALRPATYEEVEVDHRANGQALAVVALASLAAGLGARGFGAVGASDVAFFSVIALVSWVAWAFVTYEIGAHILPARQTAPYASI